MFLISSRCLVQWEPSEARAGLVDSSSGLATGCLQSLGSSLGAGVYGASRGRRQAACGQPCGICPRQSRCLLTRRARSAWSETLATSSAGERVSSGWDFDRPFANQSVARGKRSARGHLPRSTRFAGQVAEVAGVCSSRGLGRSKFRPGCGRWGFGFHPTARLPGARAGRRLALARCRWALSGGVARRRVPVLVTCARAGRHAGLCSLCTAAS